MALADISQGTGTAKKKSPVATALGGGVPQDTAFGGSNGPYIGTLPGGPNSQAPAPYAEPAGGNYVPGGGDTTTPDPFASNKGYLDALAAEQSGSQQADNALLAAQQAAIIQYGDPALAQALGIGVSPEVAAAARANYLAGNSTLARLDRAHALNQQSSINNLAAHGILFSGETGYQRGQIDTGYGNQVYDAQQALLNQNQGWLQQNLATKQNLRQGVINAEEGVYNQGVNNPANYGLAPTPNAAPGAGASTPSQPAPVSPTAAALAQTPLATSGSRLAGRQQNPYGLARRFA